MRRRIQRVKRAANEALKSAKCGMGQHGWVWSEKESELLAHSVGQVYDALDELERVVLAKRGGS